MPFSIFKTANKSSYSNKLALAIVYQSVLPFNQALFIWPVWCRCQRVCALRGVERAGHLLEAVGVPRMWPPVHLAACGSGTGHDELGAHLAARAISLSAQYLALHCDGAVVFIARCLIKARENEK